MEKGCYRYEIDQSDVDFTDKATYVALMNYILQAAGDDADRNGFGVKDLNVGNCSWVLSRMAVEFRRRLDHYEGFTVRTWVNEVTRMTTTRNMEVTDVAGEIIACVVTQWAVIDLDKRVAVDLRGHVDYSKALTDNPCPVEKPMRITHVNPTQYREHEVVYSDLDFNRHVNAMKYLVWMFDMLPLELAAEKLLARIDINFMHEARYGQVLKIGLEQGDDSIFEITEEEGQALCRAAMKWK